MVLFMSVGDGHTASVACTAYSLSSLSPALDARRKSMRPLFGKLTTPSRMYDRGVKKYPITTNRRSTLSNRDTRGNNWGQDGQVQGNLVRSRFCPVQTSLAPTLAEHTGL